MTKIKSGDWVRTNGDLVGMVILRTRCAKGRTQYQVATPTLEEPETRSWYFRSELTPVAWQEMLG